MISTRREPLSFYTSRILAGEPFTSLLYGDGEFLVATRSRTNDTMAYGEVATTRMVNEMLASFTPQDPDIVRATDINLIEYEKYQGNDWKSVHEIGIRIRAFLTAFSARHWTWYDGVVWEDAAQRGELSPFLRAIRTRDVVVVGNRLLRRCTFLAPKLFVPIPDRNAYSVIDDLESRLVADARPSAVYLVCAGLTTIPLIMRLRDQIPGATFLDLGSTFDLFVGLPTRGWRVELYKNRKAYEDVVRRNLEGVQ